MQKTYTCTWTGSQDRLSRRLQALRERGAQASSSCGHKILKIRGSAAAATSSSREASFATSGEPEAEPEEPEVKAEDSVAAAEPLADVPMAGPGSLAVKEEVDPELPEVGHVIAYAEGSSTPKADGASGEASFATSGYTARKHVLRERCAQVARQQKAKHPRQEDPEDPEEHAWKKKPIEKSIRWTGRTIHISWYKTERKQNALTLRENAPHFRAPIY